MVIPGLGQALASTVVSTLTTTFTLPPAISTITEVQTQTLTLPPDLSTITEVQTLTLSPEPSTITVTADPVISTPDPEQPYFVQVRNDCEVSTGTGSIVLVSAPNNTDFMVIDTTDGTIEYPVDVVSANQSLTFTPINGRILCAFHTFDEYYHCDWLGQPQTVPSRESLILTCPEESRFPVSPLSSIYGSSPVNIQIGRSCPHIVTQMGCEFHQPCTLHNYHRTTPGVSTTYYWNTRFRVKVAGSVFTRAQWSVSFADTDYGGPWSYDQRSGEWLDIMPDYRANMGPISVVVECKTTEEIQVRVYNACRVPVILGTPEAEDWLAWQEGNENERTFYHDKDNPTVSVTPLSGQQLCAYNERTASDNCGYETVNLSGMLDQDVIRISCSDSFPLEVVTTGQTIDLSAETSSTTWNFAIQIGCVPEDVLTRCSPNYVLGLLGPKSFGTSYPLTSPTTNLRVRMFGSTLPARLFYAEWSVQFSDDPPTTLVQSSGQWLDIIVPSDATSIRLFGSAFYTPPPEPSQPVHALFLTVRNLCATSDVLISSTTESDVAFLPAGSEVSITFSSVLADDPRMLCTSLTGRRMCAEVKRRPGETDCGAESADGFVAASLIDLDEIGLTCPDPVPADPEAVYTIPMIIRTTRYSPNFVLQVDCGEFGMCAPYVAGKGVDTTIDYPIVGMQLHAFKVRIFASTEYGEILSYVEWRVRFSKGTIERYYVPRGQWLWLAVPPDATSIDIYGDGHETGSAENQEMD